MKHKQCISVTCPYYRGEEKNTVLCEALAEGITKMGSLLKGFDDEDALLTGVESRATCPVRIPRGDDFQSEIHGLYPIGEGAGYAGGIMSSAMDGMKAVEAYFVKMEEQQ